MRCDTEPFKGGDELEAGFGQDASPQWPSDFDAAEHRERPMIVQFDGSGWLNSAMLHITNEQRLPLPNLEAIEREVTRFRQQRGGPQ